MAIQVVARLFQVFLAVATLAPISCWSYQAYKFISKNGWGKAMEFAWDYIMDGVE